MKNLIIISAMLLSYLTIQAQDKYAVYDNSYSGKEYSILISDKGDGKYSLYIDAMGLDAMRQKGGFLISEKQLPDFISAINQSKVKYEEWVNTAKENNVTELKKDIAVKCKSGGYFLYGDWNFQHVVNLSFYFKIVTISGSVQYLLVVNTGELQSSSNQFMKVDGFALVFQTVSEIDEFVALISPENISAFLSKPKAKDLFKD